MSLGPPSDTQDCLKKAFFEKDLLYIAFHVLLINIGVSHPIWSSKEFEEKNVFRKRASLSVGKKHILNHVYYKMEVKQVDAFVFRSFFYLRQ